MRPSRISGWGFWRTHTGSVRPVRRAARIAAPLGAGFVAGCVAAALIGRSLVDGSVLEVLGGAGVVVALAAFVDGWR